MNAKPPVAASSKEDATLFNVVRSTGSYEDYEQTTMFATRDEHAAMAYIQYQNGLLDSVRAKMIKLFFVIEDWEKTNSRPSVNRPLLAWVRKRTAFVDAWKDTNLTPAEALAQKSDDHTFYDIEDVAWMPPLESLLPADALAEANITVSDSLNDVHSSLGM